MEAVLEATARDTFGKNEARRTRRDGKVPGDSPEHVDVDGSELMLHQGIRVRDIATNPKWKPVTEGEAMLVHVIMPKAEEAPTPEVTAAAATATPAEPEVIKKGKKEEVEEEKKEKEEKKK